MLTGDHPARFKQATEAASRHIAEDAPKPFEFALDVRRARKALIRPLDLGSPDSLPFGPKTKASDPHELDETPPFEEELPARPEIEEREQGRLESWKNSLLDLSLRNRLLNYKDSKATITIECPEPVRLLEKLAGGAG